MKALFFRTWRKLRSLPPPADDGRVGVINLQGLVHIREMKIDDLAQVHIIDELSFSMPWPLSSYRFELIENPASMLWVAEQDLPGGARVVGMVVVWMLVDEAHIATIAVHPEARGRGIGRQLLVHSLLESVRQGATRATLEVRIGNQIAQNLYHEFGFRVVGRRPKYYQDNHEDALIMTLFDLEADTIHRMARQGSPSEQPAKEER
jgi:ribosomal-protein-alanine N-acetyltransferase